MQDRSQAFIAWHPNFNHPLPKNHRFPMAKYQMLHDALLSQNVIRQIDLFRPEPIDKNLVTAVHTPEYVERLLHLTLNNKEIKRIGFPLTDLLVTRELTIAGGTLEASIKALKHTGIGMNIAGGTHHAGSNWGEGFCMLNDQAIAADYLIKQEGLENILIIDLDVHQGNGTADIFLNNDHVFTFSMHGKYNFPFKKEISDMDVPLPDHTSGDAYLETLKSHLDYVIPAVKPDFIFYQSGVDVLASDRMGRIDLSQEDCRQRDVLVFEYCKQYGLPVEVSMGGGYSTNLDLIVSAHIHTFKEAIRILRG